MHKTALYVGSFDPFTIGHADIVERALRIFDRVVIGVGHNLSKEGEASAQARVAKIARLYEKDSRVSVRAYHGMAIDLAEEVGAVCMVRGVRSVKDFEYEKDMAFYNGRLGNIETMLLIAKPELAPISSSAVRELAAYGKDTSWMIPEVNNKETNNTTHINSAETKG